MRANDALWYLWVGFGRQAGWQTAIATAGRDIPMPPRCAWKDSTPDMPATILVVDDDPNVQRLLTYTLRQDGYNVLTATDGTDALHKWRFRAA